MCCYLACFVVVNCGVWKEGEIEISVDIWMCILGLMMKNFMMFRKIHGVFVIFEWQCKACRSRGSQSGRLVIIRHNIEGRVARDVCVRCT